MIERLGFALSICRGWRGIPDSGPADIVMDLNAPEGLSEALFGAEVVLCMEACG